MPDFNYFNRRGNRRRSRPHNLQTGTENKHSGVPLSIMDDMLFEPVTSNKESWNFSKILIDTPVKKGGNQ